MNEDSKTDIVIRPRFIDTAEYVKNRIQQISDLLKVVDNDTLKPGEVTSGPRTVFQRLPRHMRRRAMSHNIKRLPRSIRYFAVKSVVALHRKKAPSRKWCRRPTRLLKKLQRLRKQNVWLETHIWHAKRFVMSDLWGWRLPLKSFQRGFRPTFRNAFKSTVVFDLSYFCCTQITTDSISGFNAIIDSLSKMCVNYVSPSFGFRPALDEGLEITTLLYVPGEYPYGFIGSFRFSWCFDKENNKCHLQIWSHPSTHTKFLKIITSLTNTKLVENLSNKKTEELTTKDLKNISVSQQILTPTLYKSNDFLVSDLRHDLVRIRLIGPKIFLLLSKVLYLVSDEELSHLNLLKRYNESHNFWKNFICENSSILQAGNFRNGTTMSLIIEDPRLFRFQNLTKCKNDFQKSNAKNCFLKFTPPLPDSSLFWDREFRHKQFANRLTQMQMEKLRLSHSLSGLVSTSFKIPILLVIQSILSTDNLSASVAQNRIDLITPGGTGLDFWLALQFANSKAAGLVDKISLDFESGVPNFPVDCADSEAAINYTDTDLSLLKAKHLKKPLNRRLKYEGRLSVKYPFSFNWLELICDWNFALNINNNFVTINNKYYVIRDRRILLRINVWFNNLSKNEKENELSENFLLKYSNCLVAVKLKHVLRGRSMRLALICLPNQQDIQFLKLNKNAIIQEPTLKQSNEILQIKTEKISKKLDIKSNIFADFIALDESDENNDKTIGSNILKLNDLFPDENKLKKKRKQLKKTKQKLTAVLNKKKKNEEKVDDNEKLCISTEIKFEESNQEVNNENLFVEKNSGDNIIIKKTYRHSCSRLIVGRVVRGDYSFLKSSSLAFGYCPLSALVEVKKTNKIVLLRNVTSKFYHAANVEIHLAPIAEL